jgi:hypothetical protein
MNAGSDAVGRVPLDEKARRRPSSLLGHRQIAPLPSVEHVEQLPVAALPAFIAECSALQAHAAMRLGTPGSQADEEARALSVDEVADRLGVSADTVREHGERWGIALVLVRDKNGKPTRVVYPISRFRKFLDGGAPLAATATAAWSCPARVDT